MNSCIYKKSEPCSKVLKLVKKRKLAAITRQAHILHLQMEKPDVDILIWASQERLEHANFKRWLFLLKACGKLWLQWGKNIKRGTGDEQQ